MQSILTSQRLLTLYQRRRMLLKSFAHGIQGSTLAWPTLISDRNVSAGEWCRLKLVTVYK